jgi:hypothetical protein
VKPADRGALIVTGICLTVALAIVAFMVWIDRAGL